MTKEQMAENIICRFGFESRDTIGFCMMVEGGVDENIIEYWYKTLMDIDDEDNDDDYDYEDDFDECGYNPYMGCYDFDC